MSRKSWSKPDKPNRLRPKELTEEQRSAQAETYADTRWKKLRTLMLRQNPLCEECMGRFGRETPATDVHHIIPIRENPDLRFDKTNLMCVCQECHGKLEAQQVKDEKVRLRAEKYKKKKLADMSRDEKREYRKLTKLTEDKFLTVTIDGKEIEIY